MIRITTENYRQVLSMLLNDYINSHKGGKVEAVKTLAAITGISERQVRNYREETQEPTLGNFLSIIEALGRENYLTIKENFAE